MLLLIAGFYAVLSYLYSFIGFLYYQPGSHYHEYTLGKLVIEIGGHYLFGFVATILLFDLGIALLTGALAVLIDVDHLLSALNFNVSGRPDHSLLFLFVSAAFIFYFSVRLRISKALIAKLLFVGPITLLAHLSYDVFASSNGTTFQLLIPFSYGEYFFANDTWLYLELGAIALSVAGVLVSRFLSKRGRTGGDISAIAQSEEENPKKSNLGL